MTQERIDRAIQDFYGRDFPEDDRLTTLSAQGRVEYERVQDLVRPLLAPGSRVADIGGATGSHAAWLAAAGHDVVLLDPVPAQVAAARRRGGFGAVIGDARDLPWPDASFDAALVFGPLYHLHSAADRSLALGEAARVVRPGGVILAAAISRFAALAAGLLAPEELSEAVLLDILATGAFEGPGFPAAHFHTAAELADELAGTGLDEVDVVGIEGPLGLALEYLPDADDELRAAAALTAGRLGGHRIVRDLSPHLLGWGRVPPA